MLSNSLRRLVQLMEVPNCPGKSALAQVSNWESQLIQGGDAASYLAKVLSESLYLRRETAWIVQAPTRVPEQVNMMTLFE
jgi:hypothetical protein